ncbi:hypothetical protein SB766_10430 [Pseudomonas sp. SIMBA_077]
MKISDGFDARRLRPKEHRNWRARLALILAVLLTLAGVVILLTGASSLIGHPAALGDLNASPTAAVLVLVAGLLLSWLGIALWRRIRGRLRAPSGLNMAPHLMKKRD